MLNKFFGLSGLPFGSNIRSYFETDGFMANKASLETLLFGPQIALVSGQVGSGKSSLVKAFVNGLDPADYRVVYTSSSNPATRALYRSIAEAFGIKAQWYGGDVKLQLLGHFDELISQGRYPIVILDECHTYSLAILDELKTFFDSKNNFSMILIGQPSIHKNLDSSYALPLKQRISVFIETGGLSLEETKGYVEHHVASTGGKQPIFDDKCYPVLYQLTGGIPRIINQVCYQVMVRAYGAKSNIITDNMITSAFESLRYH
jgi:type II secretory pathway predicted ATPase ExeA